MEYKQIMRTGHVLVGSPIPWVSMPCHGMFTFSHDLCQACALNVMPTCTSLVQPVHSTVVLHKGIGKTPSTFLIQYLGNNKLDQLAKENRVENGPSLVSCFHHLTPHVFFFLKQ